MDYKEILKGLGKKTDGLNMVEDYASVIFSNSGVLYLEGTPGSAKTAVVCAISELYDCQFISKRLSEMDSSEVCGLPYKREYKASDGKTYMVSDWTVPLWAVMANERPTIIFFDELNRATKETRDAALQILNEKTIGQFKLNDNVFLVAAGNLGEEDGCEVEEFDDALNNRLVPVRHNMPYEVWYENYAKDNVNEYVCSFLDANREYIHKKSQNSRAYATYRSWTNLSKYLEGVCGKGCSASQMLPIARRVANRYVGDASVKFLRYLEDVNIVNLNDVLEDYEKVEPVVKKLNRARISELLNELKKRPAKDMNKKNIANVVKFLGVIHQDERMGYLNNMFKEETSATFNSGSGYSPLLIALRDNYKDDYKFIMSNYEKYTELQNGKGETPDADSDEVKRGRGRPKGSLNK